MRIARSLVVLALVVPAVATSAATGLPDPPLVVVRPGDVVSVSTSGAAARVIEIVVGDTTRFNPAAISAAPGESIKVVLKDTGRMPKMAMGHNFVLLKKGVDGKAFVEKCAPARDTEFIAPGVKDQIVAATSLIGPGETAEVTFVAPARPGPYEFLCSFPGHYALGMKGTLTVK